MTRNGKIARLPRAIRDELNQRLENGEQGVQLVNWLNGLPDVREILRKDFEGRPINEVNLTDWKSGGFLDWQAQQEALALIQELKSNSEEFANVLPGELAEPLTTAIVAQYAAAVYRSNTDTAEKPGDRVRRLGKSLRDLDRLRRREQARERIEIQREWLELERARTKHQPSPDSPEAKEAERQYHLERAEQVKQMLEDLGNEPPWQPPSSSSPQTEGS